MKKIKHALLKINLGRIYILLTVFLWFGVMYVSAVTLNFMGINIWSIDKKFSEVVFRAAGNDFMWSFFWLNARSLTTWEVVSISWSVWSTKTCFKQVRWLYYNAQRWNRIWPLDDATKDYLLSYDNSYNNLTISGWLYTSCSGDEYSIYGQIKYTVSWDSYSSYLVAWTKYNRDTNTISWEFARNFQRFDNKYPIWYIYDDRGWGIGFVGWEGYASNHGSLITSLNAGSGINNLFSYWGNNNSEIIWPWWITISTNWWNAINTLLNIWIQWTIWLSFSINNIEKNTLLWNFDRKTLIFNTLNVNFSKLINQVIQNAENICRDKYVDWSSVNFNVNSNLFCIDFSLGWNKFITLDNTDITNLKNKILVIKNGDVKLGSAMSTTDWPTSIFIDRWNLIINQNTNLIWIDWNWYPSVNNAVTSWAYLKWNFIVNGLIMWYNWSNVSAFGRKLFINWKLASLNTPSMPSAWRSTQVQEVLSTWAYNNYIWLDRVFTRECDPIFGTGSDGVDCSSTWDRNALLPLIIIDGYFPSNLLK